MDKLRERLNTTYETHGPLACRATEDHNIGFIRDNIRALQVLPAPVPIWAE
jgi:hypothetical protein